jgi:hypothetical protein
VLSSGVALHRSEDGQANEARENGMWSLVVEVDPQTVCLGMKYRIYDP